MEAKKEVHKEKPEKKVYEEPKLTYVAPKLTRHGRAADVTQQTFIAPFSA